MPLLSRTDKMILKEILSPIGNQSSVFMSRKLEIPLTTIQRRRKRLEKEFLVKDYTLLVNKLGWRRVDFFISIRDGKIETVANKTLTLNHYTIRLSGESLYDVLS